MKKEFALNDITSELTAQTDRTPKKLDIHGGMGGFRPGEPMRDMVTIRGRFDAYWRKASCMDFAHIKLGRD
jgi:hypothetical protein